MRLVVEPTAARQLRRLPPKVRTQIETALEIIATAPFAHHANVKRLTGIEQGFRLRRGMWRVLYRLDRESDTMIVEAVGPRGDVYK